MLLGSIDILMTQNIRYKVNITGFLVQGSTIGAAKLMRGDLFCSCDLPGIFFNQILDSLNTDPAALGRIEESVLMACQRRNILPDFQIFLQRFFYFRTKVYNHFISAFSGNFDSIVFEVYILNIQSDTFRYSDPGTKKESNNSKISVLRFFMVHPFLPGQRISAMLNIIQQHGNLICIQTNNILFMDLGHIDQNRRVGGDHFMFIIVSIKTS